MNQRWSEKSERYPFSEMSNAPIKKPIEFVTLPEISRRAGISSSTVRRRLARAQFVPDGFVIEGDLLTPVVLKARLPQLQTILEKNIR